VLTLAIFAALCISFRRLEEAVSEPLLKSQNRNDVSAGKRNPAKLIHAAILFNAICDSLQNERGKMPVHVRRPDDGDPFSRHSYRSISRHTCPRGERSWMNNTQEI
jgi:hypothetical protein